MQDSVFNEDMLTMNAAQDINIWNVSIDNHIVEKLNW